VGKRFGTNARIGLGLVISAVCLWLAVRQTPVDDLFDALQRVNYWWLILVIAGNVFSLWIRGLRWRVLLANRGSVAEYYWAQAIGCLITNVFPLRAGEAGRVVIISRRVGLPLVHVGASVVLERAADLVCVLGLLTGLLLIMDVPPAITVTGLGLGAALLVALVGVAILILFGQRLTPLVRRIAARLPSRLGVLAVDAWAHILAALEPMRDLSVVVQVAVWSLVIWINGIATLWAGIQAVAPNASLLEAAFAQTAIALGVALPSSPGFIGVFHLVGQQALVLPFPARFGGVEGAVAAFTVALLSHLVYYITTTILGVIGMVRLGLSLRTVRAEAEVATGEATPAPSAQRS
jgi:uncharacterized protein (TIRG00374 family)